MKYNASIYVKRVGESVVLYINPRNLKTGQELSRFYLLTEEGGKLDTSAFGPCSFGTKEQDEPVTLLIDVSGKSKRFKTALEDLFKK